MEKIGKEEYLTPAPHYLEDALKQLVARGELRDNPNGERSMPAIVNVFNALTGKNLTVGEGYEFMIILKMVRGRQGFYNEDDFTDGASYFAMYGENESSLTERRKSK